MFTRIDDLPDTVLGFTGIGEIDATDYTQTLIPAVEELIARTGKARVLIVLGPQWDGYTPAAMFEDVRLGVEHATKWDKFVLVSDAEWVQHVANIFGWITPVMIRSYPLAQLAAAKEWVSQ